MKSLLCVTALYCGLQPRPGVSVRELMRWVDRLGLAQFPHSERRKHGPQWLGVEVGWQVG
jgi:hypothetical protein